MSADIGAIVASPHFVWLWGMLTSKGRRVLLVHPDHGLLCHDMLADEAKWCWPEDDESLDLDDPATLGCLLHLVREAWGDPHAYVRLRQSLPPSQAAIACAVFPSNGTAGTYGEGPCEAEALRAALLAAPPY